MRNSILSFMAAALCVVAAGAQVSIPDTDVSAGSTKPAGSSSVAYIYVSSMIGNSSTAEIIGFSAAANGELTPIPGSPFAGDVGNLAGNGNYLFGSTLSTTDIESYAIEPNGALRFAGSTNVVTPNGGCGNAESITLDHTGASLYDVSYFGNDCTNNTYETFSINNSNGNALLT